MIPSFRLLLIAATAWAGELALGLPANPDVIDISDIIYSFDYDKSG